VASSPAFIRPATLIDSCVLLDVITGDKHWADWSAARIADAVDDGRAVINPLIFAEVSVGYRTIEELDELLPASGYEREPLPYLAGFAAGKAFLQYRRGGGQKRSPMPDFYIGAHAAVAGYRLLTRDVSRYRTYFPSVDLIAPYHEDETSSLRRIATWRDYAGGAGAGTHDPRLAGADDQQAAHVDPVRVEFAQRRDRDLLVRGADGPADHDRRVRVAVRQQ
jgi:predicted nucleic acid-binding protein